MIKNSNNQFELHTQSTSYCFSVLQTGHLEHLYYGKKVDFTGAAQAISGKAEFISGTTVAYSSDEKNMSLDNICLEVSTQGKGDTRDLFLEITNTDLSKTNDFKYINYRILDSKPELIGLPSSYDEDEKVQTLEIEMQDGLNGIKLILMYSVFEECDVITKSVRLENISEKDIVINKIMSAQLDFYDSNYKLTTFNGSWANEMNRNDYNIQKGTYINESRTGNSSNRANPFIIISGPNATEDQGECFGMNLIYSGNHYESVCTGATGKMRVLSGINPWNFSYTIKAGESFQSPEAILSFSENGFNGLSHNMHDFIRQHIVRGEWKNKPRPILNNSWEAAYFKFNQSKILKMAKTAKELGIELFVLDDGWFGKRDDDTSSLGDWYEYSKKLPGGLKTLSEKIHKLGLDFGIWVEPEMVNADSDCFRAHPDWAVKIPGKPHSEGRNQMVLDLTKQEVRQYVIDSMKKVFYSGDINYVKWDMNRNLSDYYSDSLENQGEFSHKYILGLYEVLEALTKAFPHILFESCASGGNRFDLGMLSYMPQIWASDNTDATSRAKIQTGYSYGYPMSVIGSHVSGSPNHQTLRKTTINTRFDVAFFGLLGYECNLEELSGEDKETVKEQIETYKKFREQLQFSDYYRIENGDNTGDYKWMAVSKDKTAAVGIMFQTLYSPEKVYQVFRTKGLDDSKKYHFYSKKLKHNIKRFGDLVNLIAPVHIKQDSLVHNVAAKFVKMDGEMEDYTVYGSLLNNCGIKLCQGFAGTGFNDKTRLMGDFESRLYFVEVVE